MPAGFRRVAARRDENEAEIVQALTRVGAVVFRIDSPGDLLVRFRGAWTVLEIKRRGGKLTPAQIESRIRTGQDPRAIPVVETVDAALVAIGALS